MLYLEKYIASTYKCLIYTTFIHCRPRCQTNIQPFKTQPASLYIHTDMLKHYLWRVTQICETYSLKQDVLDTHPLKTLRLNPVSQNGQKHIWLSLFSKVQWIVLRTITYNSLPQITQHRHCIGSALDIVSLWAQPLIEMNWFPMQLQFNYSSIPRHSWP